ncbi:MAG: hypothetical protein IJ379_12285, partial [Lachnospiraceae bacterium]|nr:hypothetical protein [Lachnospiraceae bacterium]
GNSSTAVLFRAVKGGGSSPQPKISAIFKVHLSLFLLTQFFIDHLTLSVAFASIIPWGGGAYNKNQQLLGYVMFRLYMIKCTIFIIILQ